MSRLDKAIEIAARKRNEQGVVSPSCNSETNPPVSRPLKDESEEAARVVHTPPDLVTKYDNPFLVTTNDQSSPASEQYRKLKSLLVKLSKMGKFDKALMVSSSVAGEGKTLTALNLAITMAQEFDHTVLLVEADIRKPSILKYLGLEAKSGLTDCVVDGMDISEVLVKTGLGSLSILPAGRAVDNPVELFSSNRMNAIFDEIKSRYKDRYVIVDTTPLLPFAEPQYIANAIGAILLVVREGVTTSERLKRSLEMISNNNLLGVVSNGVSRVNSLQGYYGYYGYQ